MGMNRKTANNNTPFIYGGNADNDQALRQERGRRAAQFLAIAAQDPDVDQDKIHGAVRDELLLLELAGYVSHEYGEDQPDCARALKLRQALLDNPDYGKIEELVGAEIARGDIAEDLQKEINVAIDMAMENCSDQASLHAVMQGIYTNDMMKKAGIPDGADMRSIFAEKSSRGLVDQNAISKAEIFGFIEPDDAGEMTLTPWGRAVLNYWDACANKQGIVATLDADSEHAGLSHLNLVN